MPEGLSSSLADRLALGLLLLNISSGNSESLAAYGCIIRLWKRHFNLQNSCDSESAYGCNLGDRNIYILHLSCRTSDLQFSLIVQTQALSFKRVCNKKHKGIICNMTFSSNSSKSTRPTGRVLWKELLILFRFHSELRGDEWNFCPLCIIRLWKRHLSRDM